MKGYLASKWIGRNKVTLTFSNKEGIFRASLADAKAYEQGKEHDIPEGAKNIKKLDPQLSPDLDSEVPGTIEESSGDFPEISDDELEELTNPE